MLSGESNCRTKKYGGNMEVGEIYRRNNNCRLVSVYYVVVISVNKKYIITRRERLGNSLVHENVTWSAIEFLDLFDKI